MILNGNGRFLRAQVAFRCKKKNKIIQPYPYAHNSLNNMKCPFVNFNNPLIVLLVY